MSFIYGSICSGIEAASLAWRPLGWRCAFLSEIEKFPRAVLQHRFPEVPIHGDFRTIEAGQYGAIDLLVGGTPCQDFSIAGKRAGLDGERGNLTLEFLSLAERLRPRWLVWENVPGAFNLGAAQSVVDRLDELRYVVDIDVLDAQYFNVPQRRRRIFVCAESADHILKSRTISSALTIAQCLTECLLLSLAVLSGQSIAGAKTLTFDASEPRVSLRKRIRLFAMDSAETASILQERLVGLLVSCAPGPSDSASENGSGNSSTATDIESCALSVATEACRGECQSTEMSWSAILGDALMIVNECITSTARNATTESKIYTCARAMLHIAKLIARSTNSSPCFWSAALSSLTGLREFTDYARRASGDLFTGLEWLQPWRDFVEQAEPTIIALGNLRVENFEQILPLSESVCWNPPPRREAGQRVAGTFSAGAHPGSYNGQDAANDLLVPVAFNWQGGGTQTTLGMDADKTGALHVGQVPAIAFSAKDHGADAGEIAPTLRAGGHSKSHANAGVMPAVAFHENQRHELTTNDTAGSLKTNGGKPGQGYPAIQSGMTVRRLTPRECERLQGFPDDFTLVPYRGKPAADGPRYKAIGNSMAVPVVRWIGERIAMVECE